MTRSVTRKWSVDFSGESQVVFCVDATRLGARKAGETRFGTRTQTLRNGAQAGLQVGFQVIFILAVAWSHYSFLKYILLRYVELLKHEEFWKLQFFSLLIFLIFLLQDWLTRLLKFVFNLFLYYEHETCVPSWLHDIKH